MLRTVLQLSHKRSFIPAIRLLATDGQSSALKSVKAEAVETGKASPGTNPFRHPIPWKTEEYYDKKDLDIELRRVMNVCHGCRRCFSLCQVFPDVFNAVDNSPTGEMDTVPTKALTDAADKCTLCDMCFLTKCPYVPPHPLNIDVPQLVVRHRAVADASHKKAAGALVSDPSVTPRALTDMWEEPHVVPGVSRDIASRRASWQMKLMTSTDFIGRSAGALSGLANWALDTKNGFTRSIMETVMNVDKRAKLPKYVPTRDQFINAVPKPTVSKETAKRKVLMYATCLVNYSEPNIGLSAQAVLEKQGVFVEAAYPGCCGMPQLEQGNTADVAKRATRIAGELAKYVKEGYQIITLVASCGLMLKEEWPLLLPNDENVKLLGENTFDICEYVVKVANEEGGLVEGMQAVSQPVVVHHACHARAQNMGFKSLEMLKMVPQMKPTFTERCSGHGGSIGVQEDYHDTAVKLCKPVAQRVNRVVDKTQGEVFVVSDCPLAAKHIVQVAGGSQPRNLHPIEIMAQAYGLRTIQPVA